MKNIGKVLLLLLFSMLFICISNGAEIDLNGNEIVSKEKEKWLNSFQIQKINEEVVYSEIKMFDINEDGKIAVLMANNTINIYDCEGNYLYGYAFYTEGLSLIYWEDNKLSIYIVRSCIKIVILHDSISLYDIANKNFQMPETKTVQQYKDYTYIMENTPDNTYAESFDYIKIMRNDKKIKTLIDVTETKNIIGKEYVTKKSDYFFDRLFPILLILWSIIALILKINSNKNDS